ncbi:MAG: hypothetical protein RIS54_2136 [Verrucomicrobiota bacterium]|jgi:HPt (histidine-containing phosphotransfer) domain-containing protein
MTNPAIIDPESIENLRSLNPGDNDEFLREIVGIFLEDTPKRLDELTECLGTQDVRRFTRAAHSIKGGSANLGAMALRAAAEKLEHTSAQDGLANINDLISEVQQQFALAKAELERIAGLSAA